MTSRGPADSTGFLLWHTTMRWRARLDGALAPLGVSHTEFVVLGAIHWLSARSATQNQGELARQTGLDPMVMSKTARQLEQKRLIRRTSDREDGRAYLLAATAAGAKVARAAIEIVRSVEADLVAMLHGQGEELKEQLRTLLRELDAPPQLLQPSPASPPNRRHR